jgi:hypothetical protein
VNNSIHSQLDVIYLLWMLASAACTHSTNLYHVA